jgi:putative flavoprotein involved in K+ transport
METKRGRYETIVIGGGQAGLAVGYHLQRLGRELLILDANERIGDSWRKRWPTLRLYSPARLDGLPGMPFPARPSSFPTGTEMADYLEAYAARFELPVRSGVAVDGLERHNGSGFVVTAGDTRLDADNVVVATGVFQHERPVIPEYATELDPRITQLHSADYRGPEQLQPGSVLVVGAAHSGGDIAHELALAGYRVVLSGRDTGQLPVPIESRRAQVVFPLLGFAWTRVLTVSTPLGRRMKAEVRTHGGPLLRVKRADLEAAGVERVFERTVGVEHGRPVLAGGRVLDVENVVWCTGFRNDYGFIRFPLPLEDDGYPEQQRGVVPTVPGLYFVGLPFLHSFASMLILGAGRDAKRVAQQITSRMRSARSDEEPARNLEQAAAA